MYDWITQHAQGIDLFLGLATFMIWLIYAQLLYAEFRRQRRPRLIINRGVGNDIDTFCVISNMSAEPIFVQYIIARLETDDGIRERNITDRVVPSGSEDNTPSRAPTAQEQHDRITALTSQGPLKPSEFIQIGTFRSIIERVGSGDGERLSLEVLDQRLGLRGLSIRLISIYGSEDKPVGAERHFALQAQENTYAMMPDSWDTRRLSSYAHRKELEATIERFINERRPR